MGQHMSLFIGMVMVMVLHAAVQFEAEPVSISTVQGLPSSMHMVGQLPSQVSPISMIMFPHDVEQSLSLVELAPAGQHMSLFIGMVIVVEPQVTSQLLAEPINISTVQGSPSSMHMVGQLPSQVSPISTTPLPQLALQSLSLVELAPIGQHPSPLMGVVMGMPIHSALQLAAEPDRV